MKADNVTFYHAPPLAKLAEAQFLSTCKTAHLIELLIELHVVDAKRDQFNLLVDPIQANSSRQFKVSLAYEARLLH